LGLETFFESEKRRKMKIVGKKIDEKIKYLVSEKNVPGES